MSKRDEYRRDIGKGNLGFSKSSNLDATAFGALGLQYPKQNEENKNPSWKNSRVNPMANAVAISLLKSGMQPGDYLGRNSKGINLDFGGNDDLENRFFSELQGSLKNELNRDGQKWNKELYGEYNKDSVREMLMRVLGTENDNLNNTTDSYEQIQKDIGNRYERMKGKLNFYEKNKGNRDAFIKKYGKGNGIDYGTVKAIFDEKQRRKESNDGGFIENAVKNIGNLFGLTK